AIARTASFEPTSCSATTWGACGRSTAPMRAMRAESLASNKSSTLNVASTSIGAILAPRALDRREHAEAQPAREGARETARAVKHDRARRDGRGERRVAEPDFGHRARRGADDEIDAASRFGQTQLGL